MASRRSPRTKFVRNLPGKTVVDHVNDLTEVNRCVAMRACVLYPLSEEHNEICALNEAIEKHLEYWTGNPSFSEYGQMGGVWLKKPSNDS